ncbi:uncharacterized protein LOC121467956 isoform X2 [Drosophila elegans]|uniref:uncharacterized protein LOC121467956 isoform X2 n=1 Tax=Drosophila elegans TaxID=30023 RepID=UPI001BC85524|nr:uncharacterized protein LOC121467956 isoform X2 [Drosophila elegans]
MVLPEGKRLKETSGSKRGRPSDAAYDTASPMFIAAINSRFDEQAQLIKSTIREVEERMLDRMLQLEQEVEELRSLKSQIGTVQALLRDKPCSGSESPRHF